MNKQYGDYQKKEIIEKYLSGMSVTDLSKQTGVARNTIYSWIKKSKSAQKALKRINMRDVLDLKQKCAQLEMMVEILQSVPCTASAPLRERYDAIEQLSDQYSVNLLCKALKVAKGSYYNHILRNKNENTIFEQKKRELAPIIEQIFHDNNQIYGASKVHAVLKDRGYKVGQQTVADIMHENGWFAIVSGAKKLYLMSQERKQNILNQQFQVTRPNEVWVSDVTYFRYNNKIYYICVILDLYARKIVSYRVSQSNSTQLTKGTFKYAYEYRQPTDLLFHSDQGANYTSRAFMGYLKGLGIRQSFSRASTPYDNSVMESFFKSMKTEKLYRTDFRSEREIREAIRDYVHYYNSKRPHSVINYRTPDAYESDYFKRQAALQDLQSNTGGSD